jgi:hypothetical protein
VLHWGVYNRVFFASCAALDYPAGISEFIMVAKNTPVNRQAKSTGSQFMRGHKLPVLTGLARNSLKIKKNKILAGGYRSGFITEHYGDFA